MGRRTKCQLLHERRWTRDGRPNALHKEVTPTVVNTYVHPHVVSLRKSIKRPTHTIAEIAILKCKNRYHLLMESRNQGSSLQPPDDLGRLLRQGCVWMKVRDLVQRIMWSPVARTPPQVRSVCCPELSKDLGPSAQRNSD